MVLLFLLAALQATPQTPSAVGGLEITRRIVRGVDTPGEAVAGYLKVSNPTDAEDALIAVSCDCASRVEFHHIRREGGQVSMDSEASWVVPASGTLDVRPGSDLHLMLIDYDPARAVDGKVSLALRFRDAGETRADFALVEDTRAAWAAFD